PYMVARICAELHLRGGEKVLDVGTGSGYQAAVLAELAAEVHSLERIPELADRAREALDAAGYAGRVHEHVADGTLRDPEHAPVRPPARRRLVARDRVRRSLRRRVGAVPPLRRGTAVRRGDRRAVGADAARRRRLLRAARSLVPLAARRRGRGPGRSA